MTGWDRSWGLSTHCVAVGKNVRNCLWTCPWDSLVADDRRQETMILFESSFLAADKQLGNSIVSNIKWSIYEALNPQKMSKCFTKDLQQAMSNHHISLNSQHFTGAAIRNGAVLKHTKKIHHCLYSGSCFATGWDQKMHLKSLSQGLKFDKAHSKAKCLP